MDGCNIVTVLKSARDFPFGFIFKILLKDLVTINFITHSVFEL